VEVVERLEEKVRWVMGREWPWHVRGTILVDSGVEGQMVGGQAHCGGCGCAVPETTTLVSSWRLNAKSMIEVVIRCLM